MDEQAELQTLRNVQVYKTIESSGHTIVDVFEIVHYCYLPSRDARETLVRQLKAYQYEVEMNEPNEDKTGLVWPAILRRPGAFTKDEIDKETIELERIAREVGGQYDGWEAGLNPAKKRPFWRKLFNS